WVNCALFPFIELLLKLCAFGGNHSTMPATHFPFGRRSICAFLALTIAFAPIVHAQLILPDLGDPAQLALSVPQERRLGESIMRDVRMSGGYLNDPEVSDYLNQ